jgi:hypothetical protein
MDEFGITQASVLCDFPDLETWLAEAQSVEYETLKSFAARASIPFGVLLLSKVPESDGYRKLSAPARLSDTAIVGQLASRVVERLIAKVVRDFRRSGFLSSREDMCMLLENGWDELCVVVAMDEIACGDRYEGAIQISTRRFIEKLERFELDAVWLQTDEASDWDCEDAKTRDPNPVNIEDVVRYVAARVVEKAGTSSNKRIRQCIEHRYETG